MIAELEQEKRRSAQVSAHCDDFTSLLQTERDKLLQQVRGKRKGQATVLLLTDEHIWWMFLLPSLCLYGIFHHRSCDFKPRNWGVECQL